MTNEEEIRLRLSYDASAVTAGTLKMMDAQKKASMEYVGFWESAIAKRDAAEIASNDASLARLKVNQVKKLAVEKAFIEKQAAMSAIAGGSGGYGSGFRTAEQIAADGGESAIAGAAGAKLAGDAVREVAHEARGFAGIMRETAVLFREGFRGNFTRMIGSASLLIGMIGSLAAAVAIPLGLILAYPAFKTYQAFKAKDESEKDLNEKVGDIAEQMRSRVEKMKAAGTLNESDASGYLSDLKHPTYENVSAIQMATNRLLPKLADDEKIKKADELAKQEQKQLDEMLSKKRDEVSLEDDIKDKNFDIEFLKKNIAALDKDSVEAHEAKARLLGYEIGLQKDLTTQAELQKKAAEESAEYDRKNAALARDYMKERIHGALEEAEFPTLEDLAGRGFMKRLQKSYGRGGRFDLGRGNGPFAAIAQDYERSKYQQQLDSTYGNMADANMDRQRMVEDRRQLAEAGVANPEQLLGKIGDDTGKLHTLFKMLVDNGFMLKDDN